MELRPRTDGGAGAIVIFSLPAPVQADRVWVAGDFNDWQQEADELTRADDGAWHAEIALPPGRHRFRYYLGAEDWENDWSADDYVENDYGGRDSVVEVPERLERPPATQDSTAGRGPLSKKAAIKKKAAKKKAAAKNAVTKKASSKKPAGTKKAGAKKAGSTKKAGTKKKAAKGSGLRGNSGAEGSPPSPS